VLGDFMLEKQSRDAGALKHDEAWQEEFQLD